MKLKDNMPQKLNWIEGKIYKGNDGRDYALVSVEIDFIHTVDRQNAVHHFDLNGDGITNKELKLMQIQNEGRKPVDSSLSLS